MTQQSAVAPSMKIKTELNLVSPNELFEHTQDLFDSITRRAYELFESRGGSHGSDQDDWFQAESELLSPVKIHVLESGDHLIARAEVPGFSPHEIKVCIEPDHLRVSGKPETDQNQDRGQTVMASLGHSIRRAERIFGVVELPAHVDPANAKATVRDSTLEVVMPKAPPAKSADVEAFVA
jgi:HSP20 family molecular chaperone IbpA